MPNIHQKVPFLHPTRVFQRNLYTSCGVQNVVMHSACLNPLMREPVSERDRSDSRRWTLSSSGILRLEGLRCKQPPLQRRYHSPQRVRMPFPQVLLHLPSAMLCSKKGRGNRHEKESCVHTAGASTRASLRNDWQVIHSADGGNASIAGKDSRPTSARHDKKHYP